MANSSTSNQQYQFSDYLKLVIPFVLSTITTPLLGVVDTALVGHLPNPAFIAADLLSQAEHGPDSQVVLVTPDEDIAKAVSIEVDKQLTQLSRQGIAEKALQESRLIVTKDLDQCITISNRYGPEHLIIQTDRKSVV